MKNENALNISPSEVPVKTSQRPKEDTKNRGEINSISIDFTENGCVVRCSFDPEKLDLKKDRWSQMPEDEKYSFNDMAQAKAYVNGMMDKQAAYESAEDKGVKSKPGAAEKKEKAEK